MDAATETEEITSGAGANDGKAAQGAADTKPLVLPSLEIKNFRAFKHLAVEKLGRVNLITGKNNVGKTSLLEALWLYAEDGSPNVVSRILEGRDELEEPFQFISIAGFVDIKNTVNFSVAEALLPYVASLFNNKAASHFLSQTSTIGEIARTSNTLSFTLRWGRTVSDMYRNEMVRFLSEEELAKDIIDAKPFLSFDKERKGLKGFSFEENALGGFHWRKAASNRSIFINSTGLSLEERPRLWDDINLTDGKQELLEALKILAPQVVDFAFRENQFTKERRIPFVRNSGSREVIPLKSLGQGMTKALDLALGLTNQTDGILLIDEIENGLHYSVLPDVWRLIFQTARRLNVQVFATTHSWDCIEAFQKAASEDDDGQSGVLVRLTNKNGDIVSSVFDEEDLGVITRDGVEVG